ncbi:hypothetical protein Fmac_005811 [Flemingia macrophylla]|uniref:Uncharacterized protein n=1 Tax=Flemingia macrophylla TaxID=520843 RepID=A0ABD1N8T7_9FABA
MIKSEVTILEKWKTTTYDYFDFSEMSSHFTGSLSSTPRFSNSHSPSSSSSAFASSTSSFSRSTSFFHRTSSPTRVNLSAPSVRFSLDRSVSPNCSFAVAPRQANEHHHKRTTLEPRFGCLLRFRHRKQRRHRWHRI